MELRHSICDFAVRRHPRMELMFFGLLAGLLAAPVDGRPRTDQANPDAALSDVAAVFMESRALNEGILRVLEDLPEDRLRALEGLTWEAPDGELPQGDMPAEEPVREAEDDLQNVTTNATNAGDDPLYQELQKTDRERNKELRLNTIKSQIMSYMVQMLGREPGLNKSLPPEHQRQRMRDMYEQYEMMKRLPTWPPADVYTEKVQSFYPSCETPRNTDEELWSRGEAMNLLFELNYPTTLQGTTFNIVAAKLRLYKLSQGNVTVTAPDFCPQGLNDDGSLKKAHHMHFPPISALTVEDKLIRVSVYWYTRSLKKHRVKRKLLDSQMVSIYGELWTEWNVRGAVKTWRDSGRNFGLSIEVEDEDGALLPADKYFSAMNCSKEASTARPIPGFLVEHARAWEAASNRTDGHFDSFLFPMIDLCTVELPETEAAEAALYHSAQSVLERHFAAAATNATLAKYILTNDSSESHRIRHHNHHHDTVGQTPESAPEQSLTKHTETVQRDDGDSIEEITWGDDVQGHQLRKRIIAQRVILKAQRENPNSNR